MTVCHHLTTAELLSESVWWSTFSPARLAVCVLSKTLIFVVVVVFSLFQEFWKEMGEMGLLGITAPGETSGEMYPVIFVYSLVQTTGWKTGSTDTGVISLQMCEQGQKMFAKVVQISPSTGEDPASLN